MRVVLDTSVLLGPDPGLHDVEAAISAISLAELHFGVLVARTPAARAERLRRLGLIEKTFDPIPGTRRVSPAWPTTSTSTKSRTENPNAFLRIRRCLPAGLGVVGLVSAAAPVDQQRRAVAGIEEQVVLDGLR
jgi:hypothetical protein